MKRNILKGIFALLLAVIMVQITGAGSLYYVVKSTTPTQIISGRALIQQIEFGNPSSSANSVSFFDHTVTTTTYISGGEIFRMEAPANDMNTMIFPEWKPTLDFAVSISTGDLKQAIATNTTSWIKVTYK